MTRKLFIVFTVVSIGIQTYITHDLYTRLAKVGGDLAFEQERVTDNATLVIGMQYQVQSMRDRAEALVELARAINNEVVGLRGEFLRRCRRR